MTTEELRKEFEAFITAMPYRRNVARFPLDHNQWPDEYMVYSTQLSWEMWQASWQRAVGVVEGDNALRVERLRELLREVMGQGVEYNAPKYALTQMSHHLRAEIAEALAEGSHD